MPLVSIIIPIFNTDTYLHTCIDSVLNQTYRNIEILLVDDGSTDHSAEICDEYARTDTRIKVFHQENQGSALSRKFALNKSLGDFVLMVDSDDWIDATMVEKMLSLAINKCLGVVWCDVTIQLQQSLFISHIKYNHNPREMLKAIYQGQVPGWFFNKLIQRSLLQDLLAYEESIMEDIFFSTQLLIKNPQMGYVAEPLYHYNRTNSAALTANKGVLAKGISNIRYCYDYLNQYQCYEEFKDSFSTLILKAKIDLIKSHKYREAQFFFSFAHPNIKKYPIKLPYSIVYWLGLNMGLSGRLLFKVYFFLINFSHTYKS